MTNIRNILTGLLVLAVLALCFMWPIPNDQLPFHRNGLIYPIIVVALGLFFSSAQAKQRLNLSKIKFVLIVVWVLTFFILINGFFVAPDIKEMFSTWDGQWLRPVLLFCAGLVLLPAIQDKFPSISAARYFTLIVLFFWGVVCVHLLDTVWLYWRDGVIHCPWHDSQFRVEDGSLVHGPATYNQPSYETRVVDGFIEVKPRA